MGLFNTQVFEELKETFFDENFCTHGQAVTSTFKIAVDLIGTSVAISRPLPVIVGSAVNRVSETNI